VTGRGRPRRPCASPPMDGDVPSYIDELESVVRDVHERSAEAPPVRDGWQRSHDRTRRAVRHNDNAAPRCDHHGRQPALAAANGLPQIEGHRRGMLTLRRIVIAPPSRASKCSPCTRSRKKTGRAAAEVSTLMDLGATLRGVKPKRSPAKACACGSSPARSSAIALREALAMLEARTPGTG